MWHFTSSNPPLLPVYHLKIEATLEVPTFSEPFKEKSSFLLILGKKDGIDFDTRFNFYLNFFT